MTRLNFLSKLDCIPSGVDLNLVREVFDIPNRAEVILPDDLPDPTEPVTALFRYEIRYYSTVVDVDREFYSSSGPRLVLTEYPVLKETPRGYWITIPLEGKRWVSKTTRKRFAYNTIQRALAGYAVVKHCHVSHCISRLETAVNELKIVVNNLTRTLDNGKRIN